MSDNEEMWRGHLILTPTKSPKSILANAIIALREAPEWQRVLAYNEFRQETVIESCPPWDSQVLPWVTRPWTDHDDLLATDWLQTAGIGVQSKITAQAVEVAARDASFHPVREYLGSLKWDNVPRLDTWLSQPDEGRRGMTARGLLDGLAIISDIMKEQGCSWAEAQGFWRISMELEAERDAPSNVVYVNFGKPDPEAA
jgi:hypothetical protein